MASIFGIGLGGRSGSLFGNLSKDDLDTVVNTVIGEAANQGAKGMAAVASVIRNRAAEKGKSPAEIVAEPHQFAAFSNPGEKVQKDMQDPALRAEATQIVQSIFSGDVPDPTDGADHYHADGMTPDWAASMAQTTKIGDHVFYRSSDKPKPVAKVEAPGLPSYESAMSSLQAKGGVDLPDGGKAEEPFNAVLAPERKEKGLAGIVAEPERGMWAPVGNFVARGADKVDTRLVDVLQTAAQDFPGYRVEAFSGYRPGDKRQHGKGQATDVRLIDLKTGKEVPNYQDAAGFRPYEQFAQKVRQVQMEKYPELAQNLRWGGYFSGPKGKYGAMDNMHFDLGGSPSLGMAGGSWDDGLTETQRNYFPGVESVGMRGMASTPSKSPTKNAIVLDDTFRPADGLKMFGNGATTLGDMQSANKAATDAAQSSASNQAETNRMAGFTDMHNRDADAAATQMNEQMPGRYAVMDPAQADQFQKDWQTKNQATGSAGDTVRNWTIGAASGAQQLSNVNRLIISKLPFGDKINSTLDSIDRFFTGGMTSDELNRALIEKEQAELSPAGKAAAEKKWWDGDKKWFGPAWSDPRSYLGMAAQSAPSTIATMLPSGMMARGAYMGKIAAGAAPEVAAAAAAKTATIAGGLGEGFLGGAQSAQAVKDEIAKMPREQLEQSDAVKSLMSQGMTSEQAIAAISSDAQTQAFLVTGVTTGMFGGLGDRALAKILAEGIGGGIVKRTVRGMIRGAISEGVLEELPQNVTQQMSENAAMQKVDPNRSLMQDVPEAAASGLAGGMAMGGVMGGAAGAGSKAETRDGETPAAAVGDPEYIRVDPQSDAAATPPAPQQTGPAPDVSSVTREAGPIGRSVGHAERSLAQRAQAAQTGAPTPTFQKGATVRVDEPGIPPFMGTIDSIDGNDAIIMDASTGELLQVPASSVTQIASSPADIAAGKDEASVLKPKDALPESSRDPALEPAAPKAADVTTEPLPPPTQQRPATERFPSAPLPGERVIVDDGNGGRFAAKVRSYENGATEAVVQPDEGAPLQVPTDRLFVSNQTPAQVEAEDLKRNPPVERDVSNAGPTARNVYGKTVVMPDDLHARLYDLGREREISKKTMGASQLDLGGVGRDSAAAIARDMGISPEAAGTLADDYRYRVERSAKNAQYKGAIKMPEVDPRRLRQWQREQEKATGAAPAATDPNADWWDGELNAQERRKILDAAGVKRSERMRWAGMTPAIREKLLAQRPSGTSEAPSDVTADNQPAEGSTTFTTAKGSVYQVDSDGRTTRDKAKRPDPGHENDFGLKKTSDRTIYVSKNASVLSSAGLSGIGGKGSRVVIKNGKASLLTWNSKENRWGIAPESRDIEFSDKPTVGSFPLELWDRRDDVPGYEAYGNMHAGNSIVSIDGAAKSSASVDTSAHDAATSPTNALPEPTQAQKEAGNYKLGHVKVGGLDISIENPAGSARSGVDGDGKPWSVEMKSHYGYIKGTVGRDKDHVDIFVKPGTESLADTSPVYVVDQVSPDGRFDEHKVMAGFDNAEAARRAYLENYTKGWKGLGKLTETTLGEFKNWLANGDTTKAFGRESVTAAPPAAPAAKPKKTRPAPYLDRYENYFRPGREVPSYFGTDRVESFNRGENGNWSVNVRGVKKDGTLGELRSHSTAPAERELAKWERENPVAQKPRAEKKKLEVSDSAERTSESAKAQEARAILAGVPDGGTVKFVGMGDDLQPGTWRVEKIGANGQATLRAMFPGAQPTTFSLTELKRETRGDGRFEAVDQPDKPTDRKPPPEKKKLPVSENTVFTDDAAQKAREFLRRKLGTQLNSGIDPEIMQAGIVLAGYHIERGARTFAAYAKAMLADLGEDVRPYLKSWYAAAYLDPALTSKEGMTPLSEIVDADIKSVAHEEEPLQTSPNEDNEVGPFGPVLRGYEGNWKEAALELERRQTGDAIGALHHEDVGPIDLVWGVAGNDDHSGYGLAKLIAWHPEVLNDLQGLIDRMKVVSRSTNRIQLAREGDSKAGIRLDWDGKTKHWLISAYMVGQRREERSTDRLSDIWADVSSAPPQLDRISEKAMDVQPRVLQPLANKRADPKVTQVEPGFISRRPPKRAADESIAFWAGNSVVNDGKRSGHEYLLAIDDDGSVVDYGTSRRTNSTGMSRKLAGALWNPDRRMVIYHNHPRNTPLSAQDISMLAFPGAYLVGANGHKGRNTRASLTVAAKERARRLGYQGLYDQIDGARRAFLNGPMRIAIEAADLNSIYHALPSELASRAGIIDFEDNMRHDFSRIPELDAAIDKAAETLKRDFHGSEAAAREADARLRRSSEPVRHIGDVAGVAQGSQQHPRDRSGQGSLAEGSAPNGAGKERAELEQNYGRVAATRDNIISAVKGAIEDKNPSILATVPLNYFPELANGKIPAIDDYLLVKRKMDAYRSDRHEQAAAIIDKWRKYISLGLFRNNQAKAAHLSDLMHASTLAGIDPSEDRSKLSVEEQKQKSPTDPKYVSLRARYLEMPPLGRELFQEVRDAYREQADETDKLLLDNIRKAQEVAKRHAERDYKARIAAIEAEDANPIDKRRKLEAAKSSYDAANTRGEWASKARMTTLRRMFESNRVEDPYFPLARFGDYFASVRGKSTVDENGVVIPGPVMHFGRYETKAQMDRALRDLQSEFGDKNVDITSGRLSKSGEIKQAMDPKVVGEIDRLLQNSGVSDDIRDALYQRWLETMPDLSMRKRAIHRKGTAGFNTDAYRVYANTAFHAGHQMARLKYGVELQENVNQAEEQAQAIPDNAREMALVNELQLRHQWVKNPQSGSLVNWLTSLGFVYYMGVSPAAAVVNASQTWMVGLPVIGTRFGFGKATAALLKASHEFLGAVRTEAKSAKGAAQFLDGLGDLRNAPGLSAQDKAAMDAFYQSGLIDRTQSHDLASIGETGTKYNPLRAKLMKIASYSFHKVEVYNRSVTALAAYRLAREAGQSHIEAINTAHTLTYASHFDMSNSSRPRITQNDWMRALTMFRSFQINMLFRIGRDMYQAVKAESPQARREARWQLAGITGMMALNAGLTGTIGYGFVMAAAEIIRNLFGDDDDPLSFEERFKADVMDILGPRLGGIVLKGVPGELLGIDLTSRIGMPDIWLRSSDRELDGDNLWNYWVEQTAGAGVALAHNFYSGAGMMMDGKIERGLEKMVPKFVRDLMRAGRYAADGVETLRGDEIIPAENVSWRDLTAQALGFTPAKIDSAFEVNNVMKNAEKRMTDRRKEIVNAFAEAIENEDVSAREKAMEKIRKYNASPINRLMPITSQGVKQTLATRARNRAKMVNGVLIKNKALSNFLQDQVSSQRQASGEDDTDE